MFNHGEKTVLPGGGGRGFKRGGLKLNPQTGVREVAGRIAVLGEFQKTKKKLKFETNMGRGPWGDRTRLRGGVGGGNQWDGGGGWGGKRGGGGGLPLVVRKATFGCGVAGPFPALCG